MPDDNYQHVGEMPNGQRIGWNGQSWVPIPATSTDYYQSTGVASNGRLVGLTPQGQWTEIPGQAAPQAPISQTGMPPGLQAGMRAGEVGLNQLAGTTPGVMAPQRPGLFSRLGGPTVGINDWASAGRNAWEQWKAAPLQTLKEDVKDIAFLAPYNVVRHPLDTLQNVVSGETQPIQNAREDWRNKNWAGLFGDAGALALNTYLATTGLARFRPGEAMEGLLNKMRPGMNSEEIADAIEKTGGGVQEQIQKAADRINNTDDIRLIRKGDQDWTNLLHQIKSTPGSSDRSLGGKQLGDILLKNRGAADRLFTNLRKYDSRENPVERFPVHDVDEWLDAVKASKASYNWTSRIMGGLIGGALGGSIGHHALGYALGAATGYLGIPAYRKMRALYELRHSPFFKMGEEVAGRPENRLAGRISNMSPEEARQAAQDAEEQATKTAKEAAKQKAAEAKIPQKPTTVSKPKQSVGKPTTMEDLQKAEAKRKAQAGGATPPTAPPSGTPPPYQSRDLTGEAVEEFERKGPKFSQEEIMRGAIKGLKPTAAETKATTAGQKMESQLAQQLSKAGETARAKAGKTPGPGEYPEPGTTPFYSGIAIHKPPEDVFIEGLMSALEKAPSSQRSFLAREFRWKIIMGAIEQAGTKDLQQQAQQPAPFTQGPVPMSGTQPPFVPAPNIPFASLAPAMSSLPSERTAPSGVGQGTRSARERAMFLQDYFPYADRAGRVLGVDPNVILAQWAFESAYGTNDTALDLNNPGGIKSGRNFARYRDLDDFTEDYIRLIQKNFPFAVGSGNDVMKFNRGLRSGTRGAYYGLEDPAVYGAGLQRVMQQLQAGL